MISSLIFIITFLFSLTLATTRDVHVGQLDGVVTFDPWFIHAESLDVVNFVFDTPNASWSVIQSSYDTPCVPLANGASSGVVQVPAGATAKTFPSFPFSVPNADPLWFFCGQKDFCHQGVVFAINPPEDQAYYLFRSQAVNASVSLATTTTPPLNAPEPTSTTSITLAGNAAVGNSTTKKVDSGGSSLVNSLSVLLLVNTAVLYYVL